MATRDNLRMAQCRQKKNYDTRAPIRERKFDGGDLVYTRNLGTIVGQNKKLLPQLKGPFLVTEVISPLLYRVVGRKRGYVNQHDKLSICDDRDIPLWLIRKRQLILTTEEPTTDLTLGIDLLDGGLI